MDGYTFSRPMLRWREKGLIGGHFDGEKGRAKATLGFF